MPEQKARYLPKLISGEHLGALAMSEAGAGSDVVSMQLRAEKRGDRYVLNGTKFWITNGPQADTIVVYAKTDPDGRRARHHRVHRREGLSRLLGRPEARQARHARLGDRRAGVSGLRGAGGERARQGRGRGCSVLMSGLDYERTVLAAGPLGLMQAALDVVLPYVHERKQFGRPIGSFQLMQGKLADMYVTLNAARAYVYAVAKACDRGRDDARGFRRRDPLRRGDRRRRSASTPSSASAATATSTTIRPAGCCATPSSTRSARGRARSGGC